MASLRRLPSGAWQSSVLLDNGRRTTKAFSDAAEATAWAQKIEEERDRFREGRRDSSIDEHITLLLSTLDNLATLGLLSAEHLVEVRSILTKAEQSTIQVQSVTGDVVNGHREVPAGGHLKVPTPCG